MPCIYIPGTPESGLAGGCYDASAEGAGIRWISVDKPGYGHSDAQPGRRLTDWPSDVAALADHLGLDRFAVVGESGGGPHALAVGHALPARVTVVILLASMGPVQAKGSWKGMRPTNVLMFWLARHAPPLLHVPLSFMSYVVRRARSVPKVSAWLDATAPAADRVAASHAEYRFRQFAAADAFRGGARPAVDELKLFARPWGFSPADLRVPVHLWHGGADVNVPFHIAVELGRQLPGVVTHFHERSAHNIGFDEREAVMQAIIQADGASS